jgi:hypothetical protein
LGRRERFLLLGAAAAALVLRAAAFFRYRFDSDEQQHLHVVWGWTAGMVQFRDYFDNHTPLFHLLMAPLLAILGERPEILLWMRVPMLVLFALVVWAAWRLGRTLFDERVARWAALLLVLFPPFFLKSLEFRNDNLWNALWMIAALALVAGKRTFLIGLILGAAFAVSVKTVLLVIALAVAVAISRMFGVKQWLEAIAGFLIVPAVVAIYFAAIGGLDELVYCNFVFNGKLSQIRSVWVGRIIFPFALAAVLWPAWRFRQTGWRWFFAVATGVYAVTLGCLWPVVSTRDFLPLMPLAAIFASAAILRLHKPLAAFAGAIVVSLVSLWHYADRFENNTDWHITMMNQVLRLSHPGETVIDLKGETIYRRRPFYYGLEYVTRLQLAKGMLEDTIERDVIRTRTHVAQADGPLWPPGARAFLNENFVNVGRLRASGQHVKEDGTFTIAVPGEYVIVSARGEARGLLDGNPYLGARQLSAGAHRFEGEKNVAALWAPAFRRGHSPFHLRDTEF